MVLRCRTRLADKRAISAMTADLIRFPSIRCNACERLNADLQRRFPRTAHESSAQRHRPIDPGPCIPWPVAPFIALGMAAAMLPWLPVAFLMHINRPE